MVVGGAEILDVALTSIGREVGVLTVEQGKPVGKREKRLSDVALPADGMPQAQGALHAAHERVDGQIIGRVLPAVVGHIERHFGEIRIMGIAHQCGVFALTANAACKLLRSVLHAIEPHILGQRAYGFVEKCIEPLTQGVDALTAAGGIAHGVVDLAVKCLVIARGMIVVVAHCATGVEQGEQMGCYTTQTDTVGTTGTEIGMFGLSGKFVSGNKIDGKIDRVAPLQAFALDGGQHGISPAQRAVALVFHWSYLVHHLYLERQVSVVAVVVA